MEKTEIGLRLRQVRLEKGYTQHGVADKAGIGVVYLSEVERGKKMPSIKIFVRIVEALEVSADYILRNSLTSGREYIYDEIIEKLDTLTPKQRKTAADILNVYMDSLNPEMDR